MLKIEVAGITAEIKNEYPYIEELAKDYLSTKEPDIRVEASPEEVRRESERLAVSEAYAESVVLYSKIADAIYEFDAFLVHGAALEYGDGVIIFLANSGVGKSTHVRLWKEAFGQTVTVLNGDKPIVRKIDGKFYAAGTPWRGKEREGRAGISEVKALCYLARSEENYAEPLTPSRSAAALISHIYMPKTGAAAIKTLSLAEELSASVFGAHLGVNMEKSAATVARDFLMNNLEKRN